MPGPILFLLGSFALCSGLPSSLVSGAATDTIGSLQVSRDQSGPLIVVRELSSSKLVTIRLSIRAEESPGLEGAGRVLQLLVKERMRTEASRFGGRVELEETPLHLVYTISGPVAAFNDMVAILRYAVSAPRGQTGAQSAVWLSVRREALADLERPDLVVRERLKARLFSGSMPGESTISALDMAPDRAGLEWFWRRWFRMESMTLVIVGPVRSADLRSAFRDWESPPPPGDPPRRPEPGGPPPPVEAISARIGLGYPGGSAEPAALALAALLVEERLPSLGLREVAVEFWWLGDRRALVLLGASDLATPSTALELRIALQLALSDAAARATASDLDRSRRRLQQALIMRTRTPHGLAGVIGEFLDRTTDPDGAEAFLRSLEEVEFEVVRDTLRTLIYSSPIVIELEP